MNFAVSSELRLFGNSLRQALADWEPQREPELAAWLDDRDDALGESLRDAGWQELWAVDEPGAVVAGGLELGRAAAPICLIDEAALGAPLAIGDRIRHGAGARSCAVALPGWGLAIGRPSGEARPERTLDGSGTVVATIGDLTDLGTRDTEARWNAWTAGTLAYLAGLAAAALEAAVEHARSRKQFGRALSAMPAVQARLADAALAADGVELMAWQSAAVQTPDSRAAALLWAGSACRDVTAAAQQVHGAIGFALESGLHRYYRRAKSVQVWAAAVCRECA